MGCGGMPDSMLFPYWNFEVERSSDSAVPIEEECECTFGAPTHRGWGVLLGELVPDALTPVPPLKVLPLWLRTGVPVATMDLASPFMV